MGRNLLTSRGLKRDGFAQSFNPNYASKDMTFKKNMSAVYVTKTLEPGEEAALPHRGIGVPDAAILLSGPGAHLITFTEQRWDEEFIYVRNAGTTTKVNFTIAIFPSMDRY